MKFKELREATLSKTQIKKVHDKADDLPKNDFIKRYGKEGDSVRFATATKMVKKELGIEDYEEGFKSDAQRKAAFASGYKEKGKKKNEGGPGSGPRHKEVTLTRNGKTKTVKGVAAKIFTDAGWKIKEELDDKDKETIKPIIKQLQKSVKAHDKQAKQLQKDIQDEVELDEGPKFDIKKIDNGGIYTHGLYYNGNLVSGLESTDKKYVEKIKKMVTKNLTMGEEVELDEVHFSNRNEPPAPKGMHKLRSGRDIPSTPQVDKIHKKVVAMTDRNDHSGARIEIAKACGDKKLVQIYNALELAHDNYSGAVGNGAIELRNKFSPVLNKAIERKFGKYADVIQDAL